MNFSEYRKTHIFYLSSFLLVLFDPLKKSVILFDTMRLFDSLRQFLISHTASYFITSEQTGLSESL